MVAHLVQRDDGGITVRAGVGVHVDVEGPDVVGQHHLVYRDVPCHSSDSTAFPPRNELLKKIRFENRGLEA